MVRRVALPAKLSLLVGASFGTASAHALSTPRHPSAHLADNSATLAPDMVYTSHSALPAPGRRGFYETRWCSLKSCCCWTTPARRRPCASSLFARCCAVVARRRLGRGFQPVLIRRACRLRSLMPRWSCRYHHPPNYAGSVRLCRVWRCRGACRRVSLGKTPLFLRNTDAARLRVGPLRRRLAKPLYYNSARLVGTNGQNRARCGAHRVAERRTHSGES